MGVECSYSFWDLYEKANGKEASASVKEAFYNLTQDKRNSKVCEWAEKAGWEVEARVGSDGLIYVAFAPTFTPQTR